MLIRFQVTVVSIFDLQRLWLFYQSQLSAVWLSPFGLIILEFQCKSVQSFKKIPKSLLKYCVYKKGSDRWSNWQPWKCNASSPRYRWHRAVMNTNQWNISFLLVFNDRYNSDLLHICFHEIHAQVNISTPEITHILHRQVQTTAKVPRVGNLAISSLGTFARTKIHSSQNISGMSTI